ncbi:MAG: helix-turn-helix transcriptional regulator [Verrucomicrobiota bacterium]
MISLSFCPHRPSSLLEAFSESARLARVSPARQRAFADAHYLRRVITCLETVRKERGIGLEELTRQAGLRKGVISRAERLGVIPGVLEFKAWSRALGLPWEEVWSMSFPTAIPHRF